MKFKKPNRNSCFNHLLFAVKAQKTVTLDNLNGEQINYVFGNTLNLIPGDTIAIPAGTYGAIRFYDINGLPEMPITIKNQGGLVNIIDDQNTGLELQRSSFVRITGSGAADVKLGIKIKTSHPYTQGINVKRFSTDVEIDHIHIAKAGFAGIMVKTDPNCNEPSTWRRNGFVTKILAFTITDLTILEEKVFM